MSTFRISSTRPRESLPGRGSVRREAERCFLDVHDLGFGCHRRTRDPIPDRAADKQKLIEDLQKIYDDTVAADLKQADGRRYDPTRLLVAIRRARAGERDPVKLVTDTIRRHTEGLDILLHGGRVDLTLEWLVVDESKPYHDLFGARSVELAQARIEEFRQAGHVIPAPGP